MAIIAVVEGAKLYMYANDHPPPHFHILFAEHRAVIDLRTLKVTEGALPKAKLRAILKWAKPLRPELVQAWDLVQSNLIPDRIR
jgi:hypothetical protein